MKLVLIDWNLGGLSFFSDEITIKNSINNTRYYYFKGDEDNPDFIEKIFNQVYGVKSVETDKHEIMIRYDNSFRISSVIDSMKLCLKRIFEEDIIIEDRRSMSLLKNDREKVEWIEQKNWRYSSDY